MDTSTATFKIPSQIIGRAPEIAMEGGEWRNRRMNTIEWSYRSDTQSASQ